MQTTFRLKASELPNLVAILKTLFKKENEVEVTVHSPVETILDKKETREEYWKKLKKRLKDLDEGKNVVSFTGEEMQQYFAERIEKYGKKK